jgi:dihydropyrimidinase
MFDVLITGGTVVSPTSSEVLDVAVQGEQVAALARPGTLPQDARRTVDARGLYVLPGVVDPHIHSFSQWLGQKSPGFGVECMAVAHGGTTTLIDYGYWRKGTPFVQSLDERIAEFASQARVDFAVNGMVSHLSWETLPEVDEVFDRGIPCFKMLLHEREGEPPEEALCYALMQKVAERGGVLSIHAEDASLVRYFTQKLVSQGKTGVEHFPHSRPPMAEAAAAHRMILLAERTGATIFFPHLSSRAAVDLVRQAQSRGLPVYGETCPHYLMFNSQVYSQDRAIQFIRFPPIQDASNQAGLWEGVKDGTINCIGTDHVSAYLWRKRELSEGRPFTEMPGGMGQVETTLSLMYTEGVAGGKITINRLVELLSANPARIFGMYPKKGTLSPGSDADIVLYDPKPKRKITSADLHMGLDYTIYEGWTFVGAPVMTLVCGEVAVEKGQFVGTRRGKFMKREISREILQGRLR